MICISLQDMKWKTQRRGHLFSSWHEDGLFLVLREEFWVIIEHYIIKYYGKKGISFERSLIIKGYN